MSVFSRQVEEFSAHMRVITIDSRGHGESTCGEKALSLYDMAEDIPYVMKDAGIDKASILGFSDGGNVAMIFAIRHPELVDKLVLSGANSDPGGLRLRYAFPMWLAQAGATIASPFSKKACKKKEFLDLMVKEPKLTKANLACITAPTLITAGEDDMISRTHTEYIHRCIAGSELRYFPGGHFTPFERPEEYNAAVADFLYIKKG
jgi:pimeloyl-ACP methyl ester carboxylesterase